MTATGPPHGSGVKGGRSPAHRSSSACWPPSSRAGRVLGSDKPQNTFDPQGNVRGGDPQPVLPVFIIAGVVGVIVFVTMLIAAVVKFTASVRTMATPKQIHGKPASRSA